MATRTLKVAMATNNSSNMSVSASRPWPVSSKNSTAPMLSTPSSPSPSARRQEMAVAVGFDMENVNRMIIRHRLIDGANRFRPRVGARQCRAPTQKHQRRFPQHYSLYAFECPHTAPHP